MKLAVKQRLLVWKYYFDKGFSLLNYVKYFIAIFAIYEVQILDKVMITALMAVTFFIICFFLGRHFYTHDWNSIELEIQNKINPFVQEVRESIEKFK